MSKNASIYQMEGKQPFQGIDRSKWSLQDFILEGDQILWEVQETEVLESRNKLKVADAHDHFMIWYLSLKEDYFPKNGYLNKEHRNYLEVAQILKAGKVPRIRERAFEIEGVDYGNSRSEKSKLLARNIRDETEVILKILRGIILQKVSVSKKGKLMTEAKNTKIIKMDVLEDKNEIKRITLYINTNYAHPRKYGRKKFWGSIYELAKEKRIRYDKAFLDYFNSNKRNPLYAKEGFKITQILKQEEDTIIPNIEMEIITQKRVTQQLNSA